MDTEYDAPGRWADACRRRGRQRGRPMRRKTPGQANADTAGSPSERGHCGLMSELLRSNLSQRCPLAPGTPNAPAQSEPGQQHRGLAKRMGTLRAHVRTPSLKPIAAVSPGARHAQSARAKRTRATTPRTRQANGDTAGSCPNSFAQTYRSGVPWRPACPTRQRKANPGNNTADSPSEWGHCGLMSELLRSNLSQRCPLAPGMPKRPNPAYASLLLFDNSRDRHQERHRAPSLGVKNCNYTL